MDTMPNSNNRYLLAITIGLILIFIALILNFGMFLYLMDSYFTEMTGVMQIRGEITNQMVQACRQLMQNAP
jgi:hypothetical protein